MIDQRIYSVSLNYCTFLSTLIVSFLSVPLFIDLYDVEYAGKVNILLLFKGIMELSSGFVTSKQIQRMIHLPSKDKPFVEAINFALFSNVIIIPVVSIIAILYLELILEVVTFATYVFLIQILTVFIGRLNAELKINIVASLKLLITLPQLIYIMLCKFGLLQIEFSILMTINASFIFLLILVFSIIYKVELKDKVQFRVSGLLRSFRDGKDYLINSLILFLAPLLEIFTLESVHGFEMAAVYVILMKVPNAIGIIAQKTVDPMAPIFAKQMNSKPAVSYRYFLAASIVMLLVLSSWLVNLVYDYWLAGTGVEISSEYSIFIALAVSSIYLSKIQSAALYYTPKITDINKLLVIDLIFRLAFIFIMVSDFGLFSIYAGSLITIYWWIRLK